MASGVYSTSRYLGSITGTSLLAGPLAPATYGAGGFGLLVAAASVAALLALALPGGSSRVGCARQPIPR